MLGQLFEDWMSSGKNWMQSSIYINSTRCSSARRRGAYRMRSKLWLVENYGATLAEEIIAGKIKLQATRTAADPMWIMSNPDLPDNEESWINIICSFPAIGCKILYIYWMDWLDGS